MKMRKILITFYALALFHGISAQEIFRLTDDHRRVLNKGWKYTMGDNPVYATRSFDDRGWKPIRADLDVHDSLPADAKTGIGWMRLKFFVGEKIRGRQLALKIHQSIASEIYLNGKQLISYGILDADPKKVKAYDPILTPIVFPLSSDSIQVLAVRFALQPGVTYTTIFEHSNSLIRLESSDHESAVNFYRRIYSLSMSFQYLMIGIWIMILIVHLSFYLWVREQKANLYFSLYSVCYLFVGNLQLIHQMNGHDVDDKFYYGNLGFFFIIVSGLLINLTVYKYLNRKIDLIFKILIVLAFAAIIRNAYPYNLGWRTGGPLFQILVFLNLIRIGIISTRQGKRGAKLLTAGAIATIVLFGLFILQGTFNNASFFDNLNVVRISTYVVYTLSFPVVISFFLAQDFALTNHRLQQKLKEVNELLEKNLSIQKEKQDILASQNQQLELQVRQRTSELRKSLDDLQSTQAQLLQSEKMASLGELTAGIAHEIQNPLNFVNNFSEVNMELSDEIMEAIKKGDTTGINQLAEDIKSNQEKILEHGHRADSIVKSMLQHSRSSTGNKELTDINTLVDEYARLSYHGIKAKDKSFNVTFKADYDPNVGACYIIPQDIGRVLLNLFNNAFYVVTEKNAQQIPDYEPTVTVTTKLAKELNEEIGKDSESVIRNPQSVIVSVKDNGNGIPEKIREKIFQPFFTTKPTGAGTGLGLSLSYDIIKAHGGELSVISREGEGAEFIFYIPSPGNGQPA